MPRTVPSVIAIWVLASGLDAHAQALRVTPIRITTDRPSLPHVEPVVAVNPARPPDIAVAAMAIEAPRDDRFHDSWRVVVFVSADGGTRWIRRSLSPTASGPAIGDANLVWAVDGSLYLTALVLNRDRKLHTWLWRSRDEGRSWSVEQVPFPGTASQDHPVLDVRAGTVGPAITVFATVADGVAGVQRRFGEREFRPIAFFSPNRENNNLGWGLDLGRGELLFTYYSMSGAMPTSLWAVRSGDEGQTWTTSRITDRHIPVGFPVLAQDRSQGPHRGRVYAVWVADEETGNVMLNHSDDGGASWSAPIVVQGDRRPVLRARPAVHVSRDGAVAVSWTDGRRDARGGGVWCWDVFAGVSQDGGNTFTPEVQLTDSLTCSQTPANGQAGQRWRWGGDYSGLASDSSGRIYVTWSDTRSGVYQPRLARLDLDTRPNAKPR